MQIGNKAPDLLGTDENGQEIRLSNYREKSSSLFLSER